MSERGSVFIGGQWATGQGAAITSTSPNDGAPLWHGTAAAPDQVAAAIAAAHGAFDDWRTRPLDARLDVIDRFSALAKDRAEEMAKLIAQETGKALWDAKTEAGAIGAKAGISLTAYHERTPTRAEGATQLTHRPHGVMAVIGPFNFPGHLPNGHIIPSLIAGNTVVFKPSELTPAVGELMVSWWEEAGLPAGVLNLVHGGADVATALITAPETRGVLFTGGVKAGLAIHRALAGHPDKILALELGGNNPLVVWDVADADSAARVIARSAFITAGQRCTCARRLIVPDGPAGQAIIDAAASLIPKLAVDHPLADPQPFIGSLINTGAANAVLAAQQTMVRHGADPIVPAANPAQGDAYLTPGLIDTTEWATRHDDEVFGPLLQVIKVRNFDDAIRTANETRFGLAAGLLSDDSALWERFRRDVHAGIVNWNRQTTGASGAAPFGGPGLSGNHRPAGYYAADYCAWPMASMVEDGPLRDEAPMIGVRS